MSEEERKLKKTSSTTFVYHDPGRTFDGSPYEASGKSVIQMINLLKLLRRAINDTEVQVRNAYMQRNLDTVGDPDAAGWETAAETRILTGFLDSVELMTKKLNALHKATTYDPTKAPKE